MIKLLFALTAIYWKLRSKPVFVEMNSDPKIQNCKESRRAKTILKSKKVIIIYTS